MNDELKHYPTRAWFNEKQADKLRAAMPKFGFSVPQDGDDYLILRQQYLSFYNIDFVDELSHKNLAYNLGKISIEGFSVAVQAWWPLALEGDIEWVVLAHGYYDHIGIYQHVLRFLLEQGFAVLAFDLPGHGLSDGERAAIENFDIYSAVLSAVRALLPESTVVHALAQSTGCAVIMNSLIQGESQPFDKLVLLAPLFRPKGWDSGQWLFKLLNKRISAMPRRFAINSHNREFLSFLSDVDPLQPKQLSVQWVAAMKQWFEKMEALADHGQRSDKCLLIIQGTDDQTVDWEYNLPQIERLFSAAKIELVEDARHQLVNESARYRKQVFQQLGQYLKA